jgi:hypothetical protein
MGVRATGRAGARTNVAWAVIGLVALLGVSGGVPNGTMSSPAAAARAGSDHSILPGSSPRTAGVAPGVVNPSSVSGGRGEVLVNFTDTNLTPASGVRANFSGLAGGSLAPDSSFQVGAEAVIGSEEAVFGLFTNTTRAPTAFFSVFSNRTDAYLHLTYWTGLSIVAQEGYDFELVLAHGTTWELSVNGVPFGGNASDASFDFGASAITWRPGLGFSEVAIYASRSPVPSLQTIPLALAVDRAGGWYLPTGGRTYFLGVAGSQWGIEGRLQHGTLAPGELESGSALANLTDGTPLWTGGPVPVRVSLSLSPPSSIAGQAVSALATVTTLGGAPLPGVFVYVADALNASVAPSTQPTDFAGSASAFLIAPNESRATYDPVRATVTLFGYSGSSVVALFVRPASQLLVSISPSSATVGENQRVGLSVHVRTGAGAAQPNVLLQYSVTGPNGSAAVLSPPYGVTDGSGATALSVLAPPVTTSLVLRVAVSTAGFWGHAAAPLRVVPSLSNLWATVESYLVPVGVVGALVAVAVLLYFRQRRRRRPVPAMGLRPVGWALKKAPAPPPREPPSGPS